MSGYSKRETGKPSGGRMSDVERLVELVRMAANRIKTTQARKAKSQFLRDLWILDPTPREWQRMRRALIRFWGHPENDDRRVLAIFRKHEARVRALLERSAGRDGDTMEAS